MSWSNVPQRYVASSLNSSTGYSVRVVFDHNLLDGDYYATKDFDCGVVSVYMLVGTKPWSEARTLADVAVRETLRDVLAWLGEETYPGPLLRAMARHGLWTKYDGRVYPGCAAGCPDTCGSGAGSYAFGCGGCCGCLGGCRVGWEEQEADERRRRDLSTVDVLRGLS